MILFMLWFNYGGLCSSFSLLVLGYVWFSVFMVILFDVCNQLVLRRIQAALRQVQTVPLITPEFNGWAQPLPCLVTPLLAHKKSEFVGPASCLLIATRLWIPVSSITRELMNLMFRDLTSPPLSCWKGVPQLKDAEVHICHKPDRMVDQ